MTDCEFQDAKRIKLEEVSYIASEIIALSILEERNFFEFENGSSARFFMTRDNAGFGDKRRWCMRFFERKSQKSLIFYLGAEKNPRNWVVFAMKNVPLLLDSLKESISR